MQKILQRQWIMNKQCEYNTNGSCIFYDVIYSTIEKVISMLNNNADRQACVAVLKELLERG